MSNQPEIITRPDAVTLPDQLRSLIDGCGLSRHRIAREIGISDQLLSAFMRGCLRRFGADTEDAFRQFFSLRLTAEGSPRLERAKLKPRHPSSGFTARPVVFEGP